MRLNLLFACGLLPLACAANEKPVQPYPGCEKAPILDAAAAERHGRCLLTAVSTICPGSAEYRFTSVRVADQWRFTSTPVNPACATHAIVFRAADGNIVSSTRSR